MSDGIIGSVGVAVVPDANDFWRRFQAQTRAGAAEAGRRAGDDWQHGFRAGAGSPEVNVRVDTRNAEQQATSLLGILATLAPAVVPLAATAGLAGGALVNMAVTGGLAIKGISNDIKAANADGLKFAAGVNTLKADLHGLEATAAHGVLGAFQEAAAKLHADMPEVNADLAQSAKVLGDIGGHLLSGLIGGFHNFAPALLSIEGLVDRLATRFDAWATGPSGAKFAQTLGEDFQHVEPLVENLVKAIGHLVAASNGPGLAIVDELNVFAKVLASIPTPILSVLTAGIVSLRIASTVAGLMDRLALSIRGVAVAEGQAARAGGFRNGLAATVGVLGRVTAGWLAFSVATGAAANATQGWEASSDTTKRILGTQAKALSDLAHLNLKGFWSDTFGTGATQAAKAAGYVKALHSALNDMYASLDQHRQATLFTGGALVLPGYGSTAKSTAQSTHGLTVEEQIQRSYAATIAKTTDALHKQHAALASLGSQSTATNLESAYTASSSALQKHITNVEKFLSLGGEEVNTYKGVSIGANVYSAALAKTGGNLEAATGYIRAQIDALGGEKAALAREQEQQQRLAGYVSDVSTKYKLTTDQVDLYTTALGINVNTIARSAQGTADAEAKMGRFVNAIRNGDTAVTGWITALAGFSKSEKTAADRAQLLGAAMVSFQGTALGYANTMVQAATANQQMVTDLKNVKKGVIDLKTGTIDYHNAAAAPLLGDLAAMQQAAMQAAAATYQLEVGHKGAKRAAADAADVFKNDTTKALRDELVQLGYTRGEADKLAQRYFHWPKNAKTQIEALGGKSVTDLLDAIGRQLSYLTHHPWNLDVTTSYHTRGSLSSLPFNGQPPKKAGGGIVTGPGSATSDSIPARLSNGEFVVKASQTAKHRPLLEAINAGAQGFETGGYVGVDYSGNANKYGKDKGATAAATFLENMLNQAKGLLASLKQARSSEVSSVSSAITGTFNIATAGQNNFGEPVTLFDIRSELKQDLRNAKQFERTLRRLAREGLNKRLLAQLAEAGPGALPEARALLTATPKQLASINSEYRQLTQVGQDTGRFIGNDLYGAGIQAAQGLVKGLKSQKGALSEAMRELADTMIRRFRADLNMHSPSRRLFDEAALAFEGYRLGIASKADGIGRAADLVAAKAIPNRPAYSWDGMAASRAGGDFTYAPHFINPLPETASRSLARDHRAVRHRLDR